MIMKNLHFAIPVTCDVLARDFVYGFRFEAITMMKLTGTKRILYREVTMENK